MAKLADLRSNLSKEEREEYEKFRSNPSKIKDNADDDITEVEVKDSDGPSRPKSGSSDAKGCFLKGVKNFERHVVDVDTVVVITP